MAAAGGTMPFLNENIEGNRKTPCVPFDQCYAKTEQDGSPGISVLDHCRIVGRVAEALLQYLPRQIVQRLGDNPVLTAALHDVGKVSPGFQLKYFRGVLAAKGNALASLHMGFDENHAAVGELTLSAVYGDGGAVPSVAQVAGAHHGTRQENMQNNDLEYRAEGHEWPKERRKLINELESEFGNLGEQPQDNLSIILLTGLACVADWIGSDESLFNSSTVSSDADLESMAYDAVCSCGWQNVVVRSGLSFCDVFGFNPYPMQKKVTEKINKPGIYVLEAPTGMGKTEAALYAAYTLMDKGDASGFYFGLPTRLTSDRIHLRVNEFLDRVSPKKHHARLAHGTAWISRMKMQNGPSDTWNRESHPETWFNPSKRALLYPFAVGTVDQALLGVLNVRHFFLRLFGLAGKAVILDEVHTYDMFTGTHLDQLVEILNALDCTVIILSATLTAQRCADLLGNADSEIRGAYPMLSVRNREGCGIVECEMPESINIRIRIRHWANGDLANHAVRKAAAGACVLCIANSVAQAQAWYCTIMAEIPDAAFDVGLLHSKFIGSHRDEKEVFWMDKLGKHGRRPKGCILVATQVVEQSVDIDADFLITELAPTDMLIQRLGRLWRHPRAGRPVPEPEMAIVMGKLPEDGTEDEIRDALGRVNTYIYSPYILCRSFSVWSKLDNSLLSMPGNVRKLLDDTYKPLASEPQAWQVMREELDKKSERLSRLASAVQIGNYGIPTGRDDEWAATRYNDRPMRDVLLLRSCSDMRIGKDVELASGLKLTIPKFGRNVHAAAQLQMSMLSIAAYSLPNSPSPQWLRDAVGVDALPLVCEDNGHLTIDNQETGLAYDERRGLLRLANQNRSKIHINLDEYCQTYSDYETEECFYESGNW